MLFMTITGEVAAYWDIFEVVGKMQAFSSKIIYIHIDIYSVLLSI